MSMLLLSQRLLLSKTQHAGGGEKERREGLGDVDMESMDDLWKTQKLIMRTMKELKEVMQDMQGRIGKLEVGLAEAKQGGREKESDRKEEEREDLEDLVVELKRQLRRKEEEGGRGGGGGGGDVGGGSGGEETEHPELRKKFDSLSSKVSDVKSRFGPSRNGAFGGGRRKPLGDQLEKQLEGLKQQLPEDGTRSRLYESRTELLSRRMEGGGGEGGGDKRRKKEVDMKFSLRCFSHVYTQNNLAGTILTLPALQRR
eukprot:201200-Hanusia_phi.AAC.2